MTYLCVLIIFVFFAGLAMTVNEGLWSNSISVMLIMLSGVLAILLGPPLGLMGQDKLAKGPEFTWYFTFAGVWLVFFVTMMILRVLADRLSRVRMRFVPPLEMVAGPLMGLLVGTMFASFLTFTLATHPVKAGEWKLEAGTWQETLMTKGSTPFYSVLHSMTGKEFAEVQ